MAAPDPDLAAAVELRFEAVNGCGRREMTPADDAYVSSWFTTVEALAAEAGFTPDELRRLMLAGRLPLPSYVRSDGAQMVPPDLLALIDRAGGVTELPAWFAAHWDEPTQAVEEWDAYLGGRYVCLRVVSPENIKRKDELVRAIEAALAGAGGDRPDGLHVLVDELDELEPPFAPFDRLRFGGPVSRDRLIDDVRRDFPRRRQSAARLSS